jgi:dienelactone hydrolase/lysophospholipase L1-like esterase
MRRTIALFCCLLPLALVALFPTPSRVQPKAAPALPKVVLVGDSIRLGYAPLVAKRLQGKAEVISPPGAGDSTWLARNLDSFVLSHKPDLVHFNVGLHDLRLSKKTKSHQVEPAEYEGNLDAILMRLKKETSATVIFASTTPIDDDRHAKRKGGYHRFEKDVRHYNDAALRLMRKHGVVVHDLHGLVHHLGAAGLLAEDGTHFTTEGKERLADAVADCVLRHLAIRSAHPGPMPGPDPKAAVRYREEEARRDALVPTVFKKLPVGTFTVPASAEEWQKRRPEVLAIARQSLGDLPPRPKPSATLISREIHTAFILESLTIPNGVDGTMTAMLLLPHERKERLPAVMWLHSSSYDHNQLLMRGYNGGDEPFGEALVKAGFAVLAPDACWYGGRARTGPAGTAEEGRAQQETLMKLNLWFGRTLWGMFVRDDQVALDYLCSRPEIDTKRIGATGMSMGSTRSWWLAAMDERIACTVGVACLTRYQNLIAHGQLRQHGVYYFVNGILKHFDVEGVIALIAPRPFLALTGDLDAGSPADGIRVIEERVAKVYAAVGAKDRFASILYKDVGHAHTPVMRKETLAWLRRWLGTRR